MVDASALPSPVHRPSQSARLAYVLLLGLLGYAAAQLASDIDLAARVGWLNLWTLVAAGAFAIALPNTLLPDANASLLQILNWPPTRLLRYQLKRAGVLLALVGGPLLLVAYFDPATFWTDLGAKTSHAARVLLVLTASALDAFAYYATIGRRSQAWQEGTAGLWYARLADETGQGVDVPRGLVPSLFGTARCFVVAVLTLVTSAALVPVGSLVALGPGLLLLMDAGRRLAQKRGAFDRHFYHTNAFYAEVLGGGTLRDAERSDVTVDALYWVPRRWRPATWASLRQFDRRLPLGRLVALGHLLLWVLCLQESPPAAVSAYVIVFFTAQNAACGLLGTASMAPPSFHLTMQSTGDWWATRTFVNLRWLFPHAASLSLVALADPTYAWTWAATWIAADVVLASLAAGLVTLATETRARRQVA